MSREQSTHRRPIVRAIAMAGLLVALSASAVLAGAGNNGTVKIHEGATDVATTLSEDAHVCTFHVHFFFADAGQAGDWSIDQAPPTGTAPAIITGSYLTDSNSEYQTVELGLPIGHYDLSWNGRDDHNVKHKSFWVTCDNSPGPIGGIG